MESIAILGTGLLGTSVGLALRAAGFQGEIVGWNRNRTHAETGAADGRDGSDCSRCDRSGARGAGGADFGADLRNAGFDGAAFAGAWAGAPGHGCGEYEGQITEAADRLFNTPERAGFLPGHPMAGKERGGAELGDANLFRGAVWLFTDFPAWHRSDQRDCAGAELARVGGCDGRARDRSRCRSGMMSWWRG